MDHLRDIHTLASLCNERSPTHLDLDLVPLLGILQLPVPVPDAGPGLVQLLPGDLPEGVHLVSLQLEKVPLLPLSVQLIAKTDIVLLQLGEGTG